jgi:hypothetical protein
MIYVSSIHSEIHMWSSIANCFVMTLCIASKVVGSTCLHHPEKNYQKENTMLNVGTCFQWYPPRREEVVYWMTLVNLSKWVNMYIPNLL